MHQLLNLVATLLVLTLTLAGEVPRVKSGVAKDPAGLGQARTNVVTERSNNSASVARARRQDQSKDLKKLIQELEESDYSNYGSWGNFRTSRKPQLPLQVGTSSSSEQQEATNNASNASQGESPQDDLYPEASSADSYFVSDFLNPDFVEPDWQQQNENRVFEGQVSSSSPPSSLQSPARWRSLVSDDELSLSSPSSPLSLKFSSVVKLTAVAVTVTILSYLSVVPQTLAPTEYNLAFKALVVRVSSSMLWPAFLMVAIFRGADADVNAMIGLFVSAFFLGYPILYVLELLLISLARVAILKLTDPKVFERLCPRVPGLILPWMFREEKYLPSRLTTLLFSAVSSCVVAPVVEEFFKLKLLRSALLGGNGATRAAARRRRGWGVGRREEAISPPPPRPLTVRSYMIYMAALTMGLKVADNTRRILVYTSPHHRHKGFFAIARGVFPVQELCGAMTALAIARRDVLGLPGRDLTSLAPAVILHAAANLRGMKPISTWSSKRPWDELQLQALNAADDAGPQQLLFSGISNLLWFMVLARIVINIFSRYASLEYLRGARAKAGF